MKTKGTIVAVTLILIASCALLVHYMRTPGKDEAAIYRMMHDLTEGMTVEQVSAIVSRHRTPAIKTEQTDTRISVWTDAGLWDAIHLRIDFADDKLAAARIRNADANAPIKRAPSDIPENKESSNKGLVRTGDPRTARPSAQP